MRTFAFWLGAPGLLLLIPLLLGLPAGCDDYSPDDSYIWGDQQFKRQSGDAIGWIGDATSGWKTIIGAGTGSDVLSFDEPGDVFVEGGYIYVADRQNHRVSRWGVNGMSAGWIGGGSNGWHAYSGAASGSDMYSFNYPSGLWIHGNTLYVSDSLNNRVCRWNLDGTAVGWIGGGFDGWQVAAAPVADSDYQSFDRPYGLCVDPAGLSLYVADWNNNRICRWQTDGTAAGWIGEGNDNWQVTYGAMSADDMRSFNSPRDVFIMGTDLLIADTFNNRISRWTLAGTAVGWIGDGTNGWQTGSGVNSTNALSGFYAPASMCVNSEGDILVADMNNHRVCKWSSTGDPLAWLGDGTNGWHSYPGATDDMSYMAFALPSGLCTDANGDIFIAESWNYRVSRWADVVVPDP